MATLTPEKESVLNPLYDMLVDYHIGKKKIKDHQFPLNVTKKDGYVLTKPESW